MKSQNSATWHRLTIMEYYERKKSHQNLVLRYMSCNDLKMVGPFSKLCMISPFSTNFRSQIKNYVSYYRLLRASSLQFATSNLGFNSYKCFIFSLKSN